MDQYQWPGTLNSTTAPNTSLFGTTEYEMRSMKALSKLILAVILNKQPTYLRRLYIASNIENTSLKWE